MTFGELTFDLSGCVGATSSCQAVNAWCQAIGCLRVIEGGRGRVRGKVGEWTGELNKDARAAWRAARVSNEGIQSQRPLALCSVVALVLS